MSTEEKQSPWQKTRRTLLVLSGTPRVFNLCWKASSKLTISIILLNSFLGLAPLAEMWIVKLLIDFVTAKNESLDQLFVLIAALAVVRLLSNSLQPTLEFVQEHLGDYLTRQVKVSIFNKAGGFTGISIFENPDYYDKLQKAQNESSYRPLMMLTSLSSIIRSLISLSSMLLVLVIFQPLIVLALLVLSLPHLIAQFKHQDQSWSINDYNIPEVRRMEYFTNVLSTRHTAKEIRLFGLQNFFLSRFLDKFKDFQERRSKLRKSHWRNNISLAMLAALGTAGAYGYVILRALSQSITIGSLSLYLSAITQVQFALETIIWAVARLYESNLFVNNVFEFLAIDEASESVDDQKQEMPVLSMQDIKLENVSFSYASSDNKILDNLSLIIPAGKTVALVGENGAGKSTIVKLLARLHEPTEGKILFGDKNLSDITASAWRKSTSMIFQDFNHYHMTVRENIGMGQVDLLNDQTAIEAAAKEAGANSVVEKLDGKYETLLGLWFPGHDRGAEISGGEWQKLALARTFMRTNAIKTNLLVLDEPTAALDAKAEHEVFLRFHELTRGRTTLLISHRLSTVKMADIILLLENGKIVESGSHEELMQKQGEYSRMYNLQAEKYK